MSRVIPGLQAEIIDFQIQSDPITNPGEIVVLLCDLPDQVTITDPENPDEKSNITNEFILTGCFIESIGGFNLDYENETEVIKYSVSINYTFGY